ncbi:MAG: EAL domain-containing protein, partial [Gallionellaceae bacterium]|nr:EAL domain-containing protein [Gallionellaceae bacterium]
MRKSNTFRIVRPYLAAVAVIVTAALLVFTIYFTQLSLLWATFLAGILTASILAVATRASHTEWVVVRRTAQLSAVKERLEDETRLRKQAEKRVDVDKPRIRLIDEALTVMVALVDTDLCYQYHNRAFRNWLHMRPEQIDGRTMRKVLGAKLYTEMEQAVRQSLKGQAMRYTLMQERSNSSPCPVFMEHVPQFSDSGKVIGFYLLAASSVEPEHPADVISHSGLSEQDMYINSFAEQMSGQQDAVHRIMAAIEKDEFHLFCQLIIPLAQGTKDVNHYEILVRLLGEEDNMMPPGAFFPLAEKHGLMPHLDRWVVQHVAEWISNKILQGTALTNSIFFINIASDTIEDNEFPQFVQEQLKKYNVPGNALCFEIAGPAAIGGGGVIKFAQQIREAGCRTALSNFGQDGVSFDLLRDLRVDFLKIDGSIILHILRDPVYLAKISAINQV